MTDINIDPESTDPLEQSAVRPAGPFHPRSRKLADRDPDLPISYRAARWLAVALIITTTTLTAWWLVDGGLVSWFVDLFWRYQSWLPG